MCQSVFKPLVIIARLWQTYFVGILIVANLKWWQKMTITVKSPSALTLCETCHCSCTRCSDSVSLSVSTFVLQRYVLCGVRQSGVKSDRELAARQLRGPSLKTYSRYSSGGHELHTICLLTVCFSASSSWIVTAQEIKWIVAWWCLLKSAGIEVSVTFNYCCKGSVIVGH